MATKQKHDNRFIQNKIEDEAHRATVLVASALDFLYSKNAYSLVNIALSTR